MVQPIIVLLLLISTAAAEECVKYGAPINLRGTLLIKGRGGLQPVHCTQTQQADLHDCWFEKRG
jgi:hypothetical protein